MSLGDTAPLITIAHDWTSPPELVRSYPTSVLPHAEDGTQQRMGLSHISTDVLTYRLIAPTALDAAYLTALPDMATDTIVRIPRWEDQTRVDPPGVSAGSAVVIPCDTTAKPTFVVGSQVILWRSPSSYEVTTIDAVADDSITADLANDWGAGTIVAPVMAGRLAYPVSFTHWVPTTGALELAVAFNLRDVAGIGTGGDGEATVPTSIEVHGTMPIRWGGHAAVFVVVRDAEGNVLYPPRDITWSSADPTNAPVWASSEPGVALVGNPNAMTFLDVMITATLPGGLSDSAQVTLK
jgi:hypothetical protein